MLFIVPGCSVISFTSDVLTTMQYVNEETFLLVNVVKFLCHA